MPATPGVAPTPSGVVPVAAPPRTTTPRPGVPRPPPTHQQPSQPRGRTPVGIGTPHSVSTPASGGAAPAPPPATTPAVRTQLDPAAAPPVRGLKREREESGLQVNGNIPPPGSEGLKIAKAGVAGVRPRPVKKQRLVRHSFIRTVCEVIARFGAFVGLGAHTAAGCKWAAVSAADTTYITAIAPSRCPPCSLACTLALIVSCSAFIHDFILFFSVFSVLTALHRYHNVSIPSSESSSQSAPSTPSYVRSHRIVQTQLHPHPHSHLHRQTLIIAHDLSSL